jgi:hypothetical protein
MLKRTLIILGFLVITACGGEGGSTTPTDPDQLFSLDKIQSTTPGTVYATQITGSDSDGTTYTGSFTVINQAQIMLNGVLVTPRDTTTSVTGGNPSFTVTVTNTGNYDTNANLISVFYQPAGPTCTLVSPDKIPGPVKIGDSGSLSTSTCDDGTTEERIWRIADAGNGRIHVISTSTSTDQFSVIDSVAETTITIDGNGDVVAFKAVSTLPADNFTFMFQSI